MRLLPDKIKPTRGFSHLAHIALKVLLPVLVYILVRVDFVTLAIILVLLSKWRMFAVRPRYWTANVLSSGVDLLVTISFVLFMANTSVAWWQLFWTVLYAGWLVWLKPRSDVLSVSAQAMLGQLLALSALYLKFGDAPLLGLVAGTWLIAYVCTKHFLASFNESHAGLIAYSWAYFAASLAFVLGHWLLFYGLVAQIVLLLTVIGYSLAALYYLDINERLSVKIKRQMLSFLCAILVLILVLSDWKGVTV